MFSQLFIAVLIYLALAWTATGALVLVVLLAIDRHNRRIW